MKHLKKTWLEKEKHLNRSSKGWMLLSILTGSLLLFNSSFDKLFQSILLTHIIISIPVTFIMCKYLYFHIQRTIGIRRFGIIFSGIGLTILLCIIFISGFWLVILGSKEKYPLVDDFHLISSILFMLLLIFHIIWHIYTLPDKRRTQNKTDYFLSYTKVNKKTFFIPIIFSLSLIIFFILLDIVFSKPYNTTGALNNYNYPYGKNPFLPSKTATYHGKFLDDRQLSNSKECANCHQTIFDQWHDSAHRKAASDITYVKNITLLESNKNIEATRYCEGCHAPIALLTGELSVGGKHGGVKDTKAHHEGISCLSCHAIDQVLNTEGVASYQIGEIDEYLFTKYDSFILNYFRRMLIKSSPLRHKKNMSKGILTRPELCASCHAQFMDKDMNGWGWVKMQDDYSAWHKSPFSGRNNVNKQSTNIMTCQNCHMAEIDGEDPSASGQGKIKSHKFLGANTMLALVDNDTNHLQDTIEFLQKDKLRVEINVPDRNKIQESKHVLNSQLKQNSETPDYFYLGEEVHLQVIVSNIGVGHNFPGGTIDLNEAWLALSVFDAAGDPIYQTGHIQSDDTVDPDAYFYKSIPVDRKGNEVWKHDLFNKIGESFKRVIPAGKSDLVDFNFIVPSWAESPITIIAILKYRKLNPKYAKWAMGNAYKKIPVIDLAYDSITLPLLIKAPLSDDHLYQ